MKKRENGPKRSPFGLFVFGLVMIISAWVAYYRLYPQVSNPSELILQKFYILPPSAWPVAIWVVAAVVSLGGLLCMWVALWDWFPVLRPPFRWLFGVKSESVKK